MYNDTPGSAPSGLVNAARELRPPTVREQLLQQKEALTARLKEVDEAIAALDENPAVEKVLTLVGRTVRF